MSEPSWRKPVGIFAILAVIGLWAVVIASLSATVGRWPILLQSIFYIFAGIVWILPLKPLLRWMETGRFRPSEPPPVPRFGRFIDHSLNLLYWGTRSPLQMNISLPFEPLRPWRTHPRETVAVGVFGAALLAIAGVSGATPTFPSFGQEVEAEASPVIPLSKPLPNQIRDLAPETAFQVNSSIPVASGPNPAAAPFLLGKVSGDTRARALECLTSAIYYEAAQEATDGQRAVAQVVLNRLRHPAFPNSVCGVVYEGSTRTTGCQFTFTCDGSMARAPMPALWNRARKVADEALKGAVYKPVGLATHYHANYVVPYWASSLVKTSVEGAHIFYRWPGGWGRPPAFSDRWTANEGNPAALRLAALSAPHTVTPLKATQTEVEKLEAAGARVIEGKDGRIRMLFTPQAREAVEKVKHVDYVQRVAASDNLRFALDGGPPPDGRPFGRAPEGAGTAAASSTAQ